MTVKAAAGVCGTAKPLSLYPVATATSCSKLAREHKPTPEVNNSLTLPLYKDAEARWRAPDFCAAPLRSGVYSAEQCLALSHWAWVSAFGCDGSQCQSSQLWSNTSRLMSRGQLGRSATRFPTRFHAAQAGYPPVGGARASCDTDSRAKAPHRRINRAPSGSPQRQPPAARCTSTPRPQLYLRRGVGLATRRAL